MNWKNVSISTIFVVMALVVTSQIKAEGSQIGYGGTVMPGDYPNGECPPVWPKNDCSMGTKRIHRQYQVRGEEHVRFYRVQGTRRGVVQQERQRPMICPRCHYDHVGFCSDYRSPSSGIRFRGSVQASLNFRAQIGVERHRNDTRDRRDNRSRERETREIRRALPYYGK